LGRAGPGAFVGIPGAGVSAFAFVPAVNGILAVDSFPDDH